MVYLVNRLANSIIDTFNNVLKWDVTFVEYMNSGYVSKLYNDENSYFTDKIPIETVDENEDI